jgi:hypothetical protein
MWSCTSVFLGAADGALDGLQLLGDLQAIATLSSSMLMDASEVAFSPFQALDDFWMGSVRAHAVTSYPPG